MARGPELRDAPDKVDCQLDCGLRREGHESKRLPRSRACVREHRPGFIVTLAAEVQRYARAAELGDVRTLAYHVPIRIGLAADEPLIQRDGEARESDRLVGPCRVAPEFARLSGEDVVIGGDYRRRAA